MPGKDRQPSRWYVYQPLSLRTGLMTTMGERFSSSGNCMTNMRLDTPTCGAARPTPLPEPIMVAIISRPKSSSSEPKAASATGSATFLRMGSSHRVIFSTQFLFARRAQLLVSVELRDGVYWMLPDDTDFNLVFVAEQRPTRIHRGVSWALVPALDWCQLTTRPFRL